MIAILDYGMGNLRSVQKALEFLAVPCFITDTPSALSTADHIILPGVGAFSDAMTRIRALHLDRAILSAADAGVPILGICLGMQMLFQHSEENGFYDGLGLFPGTITKFRDAGLKIPIWGGIRSTHARASFLTAGSRRLSISSTATVWRMCRRNGRPPPALTGRLSPPPYSAET